MEWKETKTWASRFSGCPLWYYYYYDDDDKCDTFLCRVDSGQERMWSSVPQKRFTREEEIEDDWSRKLWNRNMAWCMHINHFNYASGVPNKRDKHGTTARQDQETKLVIEDRRRRMHPSSQAHFVLSITPTMNLSSLFSFFSTISVY